ncbi:hypothetical protein I6F15_15435 [Bradyrhizobium sp. BRP14]|nr:hypothetical protein [Bradyrhizobium sp. BRP14]
MGSNVAGMTDEFISSANPSIALANEIEVTLDNFFPDDDYLQHTVEMLARYHPEGGEYLFTTDSIRLRLQETKEYLRKSRRER